jgi:hypothetical protein
MRLEEIDWRFSSTRRIFQALSEGMKDVKYDFDAAQEDYQIDIALDHIENLFGIAFVTAQTYIVRTVSDANQLLRGSGKFTKEQLLKDYSSRLGESAITNMELCDAIANYFKHHDEWVDWAITSRNQKTISVLHAAGIQEWDEFPCRKAADVLWSANDGPDLEPLLILILNWREAVIGACRH